MVQNTGVGEFKNHDRNAYPKPIVRVTGGLGGEALLILGDEKTALYDAGMACFGYELVANIEAELLKINRSLDYIFLSHSHYDHIGGLPYVLERWPEALVYASEKTGSVFKSEGALALIKRMGENAAALYEIPGNEIKVDGMRVDHILKDGERVSLGKGWMEAYETKGHTDCSMSYMLMPWKILFTSESTGVILNPERIEPSALKDFDITIDVANRLKAMDFDYLISPHFGVIPQWFNDKYFDLYITGAKEEKKFIESKVRDGLSYEEILEAHKDRYWNDEHQKFHPFKAYRINTENVVKQVMKKINI